MIRSRVSHHSTVVNWNAGESDRVPSRLEASVDDSIHGQIPNQNRTRRIHLSGARLSIEGDSVKRVRIWKAQNGGRARAQVCGSNIARSEDLAGENRARVMCSDVAVDNVSGEE
ncbi:hypothetical protein R1flu_017847 [Riccia fluitans]|uniref:Uncharacterized protein n=1 Tax=Riccia fluitans TaxID=41844 RepID=A0ABD1ZHJ1_9MARC